MIIDTIPQLKKLSNTEKLLLINELWDSLSLQEDTLPVPETHKKILDERLRDHEANPEQGSAWKEVKSRILKKMNLEIFIKPRAESDLLEAFKFYDEQSSGLGDEFIRCVDTKLEFIRRNPKFL